MIPVGIVAGSGQGTFPSAVTSSATQTSFSSITLSWTAPFNGGAPITSYSYQVSTDNSSWGTAVNAGLVTSVVVGSLSPGTTYYFRVLATNSIGSGPYGASSNAATAKANTNIASSGLNANFTNISGGGYGVRTITGTYDTPSIYAGSYPGATVYNYIVYCNGLTNSSAGGALSGKIVNLYMSASGYANQYLGSATTDGSGNASLSLPAGYNIASYVISGYDSAPDAYYFWTFNGDSQFNGTTQTASIVGAGWFDWNS
jgi:hypothetical protein